MATGFTRGDRIPDFKRLNHAGEQQMLYDLHAGKPIILLLFDDPDTVDTSKALNAFASDNDRLAEITRVALIQGTPAQCNNLVNGKPIGITLLVDDGSVATHLLGSIQAGKRLITAFAMDANFRVIERVEHHTGDDLSDFLQRLTVIYKDISAYTPRIVDQLAPVLFIPRVLEPGMCRELVTFFEQQGGQPSGSAYIEGNKAYWRVNPDVKMRRDIYIKEGVWLERIKELLVRRVLPEINRAFHFQVTQHEVFKLVCYDAETGGYFRPHRDNESRDTQHRRFAMTLNLNAGDYSGGQLRFPEFGADLYAPQCGDAIVFSSSLLHEVMPVTAGKRYVLLGFFFSDAESIAPMEYVPTS